MKMLSKAVASKLENFAAPKRGDEFEDLCLDIFEYVLSKQGFPIIGGPYSRIVARGVSGNSQGGVDIVDPEQVNSLIKDIVEGVEHARRAIVGVRAVE